VSKRGRAHGKGRGPYGIAKSYLFRATGVRSGNKEALIKPGGGVHSPRGATVVFVADPIPSPYHHGGAEN